MEVGNNLSEKGKKDLLIVNRAKDGDQAAFAELMNRYREPVYYMLLKMIKNTDDAEDLTIEAFGKAFNRIEQYTPNYAFSTWLFKIASNNCIDHIRKKRISLTSMDHAFTNENGESVGMQIDGGFLDPEETFIKQQKVKAMRDVVDKLKPRYKELIIKRYFEELSYDEIAEELDLPLGTVKAQLFRAREFLANVMKKTKDTI
ncbi:RNA polymerase sigma factor [Brumimicrobium oceani]|uniref:RNA polymerase subunit sigma-24 n=1 Tax=Brumimicrobium oceani TaxID=2100725 RepID=A0A2U2X0R7_9FLAO|nr:sigma-70 family RNA polymerase sigma factor [Brumimicrobium oceani]PWH81344.1 RNA polymerase subunit sigma-24 [Brumimicrobium oceani]